MKYRLRKDYEAIQWKDNLEEVSKFLGFTPELYTNKGAYITEESGCLNIPVFAIGTSTRTRPCCCWPGNFIVRDSEGDVFIVEQNFFLRRFEPVE